ncbi:MAG: sensor histidine kinase [Candidatus Saccharimonadales bacterium]
MARSVVSKQFKSSDNYFSDWDRNLLSLIHELSGPLTAASLNLDSYLSVNKLDSLKSLRANIKLMEDYLNNARQQIKHMPEPPRTFSVNKQLSILIKNLSSVASQRQVELNIQTNQDYVLRGNTTRFKQIISCFIRNGIEAYDGCLNNSKQVIIRHRISTGYLVIDVIDQGSGITEMNKLQIFKPYYSTKQGSSGLGLGLSLAAESIAKDFNGYISVDSKPKKTTFKLYFKLPTKPSMLK